MIPRLTVGITTRNRPESLNTCLRSLRLLDVLSPEILVFDDASSPPAIETITVDLPNLRVLRDETGPGHTVVGRNRLVREASSAAVLLLDDDARVLSRESIDQALAVLDGDPRVAAVAFAQAEADGRPWPARMQPSPVTAPCLVASFIGFAHLVRRDVFLAVDGYREDFNYLGEEKELCLRFLDAGHCIVYLPEARIGHVPDSKGRDQARSLRLTVRNDCLTALYNDPMPRVLWTVPARYLLYFRMRYKWRVRDPWGWLWIARELIGRGTAIAGRRRPVSRATLQKWQQLKRSPPYSLRLIASVGDDGL
jgi:GT2 family glycosyltransferase